MSYNQKTFVGMDFLFWVETAAYIEEEIQLQSSEGIPSHNTTQYNHKGEVKISPQEDNEVDKSLRWCSIPS